MTKRAIRVVLTFPDKLIRDPLIYTAAKNFSLIPNIRQAKVTEAIGKIELELEGTAKKLERGISYFKRRGIEVELISPIEKTDTKIS